MNHKLEDRVYTIIKNRIYWMMIESATFKLKADNSLFGTYTLIDPEGIYNDEIVKYENEIYKTIDELKEKEYSKIDELIKHYKK